MADPQFYFYEGCICKPGYLLIAPGQCIRCPSGCDCQSGKLVRDCATVPVHNEDLVDAGLSIEQQAAIMSCAFGGGDGNGPLENFWHSLANVPSLPSASCDSLGGSTKCLLQCPVNPFFLESRCNPEPEEDEYENHAGKDDESGRSSRVDNESKVQRLRSPMLARQWASQETDGAHGEEKEESITRRRYACGENAQDDSFLCSRCEKGSWMSGGICEECKVPFQTSLAPLMYTVFAVWLLQATVLQAARLLHHMTEHSAHGGSDHDAKHRHAAINSPSFAAVRHGDGAGIERPLLGDSRASSSIELPVEQARP